MYIYIVNAKSTLLAKCMYIVFGYLVLDKYSLCANHYHTWLALNVQSLPTACTSQYSACFVTPVQIQLNFATFSNSSLVVCFKFIS
jgi:hypothetical protein